MPHSDNYRLSDLLVAPAHPSVKLIAGKVVIVHNPKADAAAQASKSEAMPARVKEITHQGKFSAEVREPSGGPGNSVTLSQIMDKFRNITRGTLTPGKRERVPSYIEGLDQMDEGSLLLQFLHKRPTRRAS